MNEWRFERKFVIDNMTFQQIEDFVLENSFLFSEIYNKRKINNIYFDDIKFSAYHENIEGLSDRKKYRLRWYGDFYGEVKNPVLELKIKKASLGKKVRFDIKNFTMKQIFDSNIFKNIFLESNLPIDVNDEIITKSPSLINSYERKYYLSKNKLFRITLDKNLSYYYVSPNIKEVLTKNNQTSIIVEIKYDYDDDMALHEITNQFPFRLSRNSKYVQGFSSVNDIIY